VTDAPVTQVGALGRDAIEGPQALGQMPLWGFEHEMIMGPYQAIGVTEPLASCDDLTQDGEKQLPVVVILVDGFVSVTTRRD
jgi:hypothetical protein